MLALLITGEFDYIIPIDACSLVHPMHAIWCIRCMQSGASMHAIWCIRCAWPAQTFVQPAQIEGKPRREIEFIGIVNLFDDSSLYVFRCII